MDIVGCLNIIFELTLLDLSLSMLSSASLCKAAYDDSNPNAIAETMQKWGQVDEAQIETVKDFLTRFGCTYGIIQIK